MVEKKILTLSLSAASMVHSDFTSAPPKIQSVMKRVADAMFDGDLEKLKMYFAAKQVKNTHIEEIREICN
jgi:predicted transcriptional regulator